MFIELLLLFSVLVFILVHQHSKVPKGLPPGSLGWPVLGTLPPRNKRLCDHLMDLKKKYGKIFTTKWGSRIMVIICDPQLAKKALNHPDFHGRGDFHIGEMLTFGHRDTGLLTAEGKVWSVNRQFVFSHMQDLGMGKTPMVSIIQEEAEAMVEYLGKKNLHEPVGIDIGIDISVLNVTWMFMAGTRYSSDDQKILKLTKMMSTNFYSLQDRTIVLDFFPWLLPFTDNFIGRKIFRTEQSKNYQQTFTRVMHEIIDEHRQCLDPENPRDLIDFYLLEIEKEKDNPDTIFKEDWHNLVTILSDMYLAGFASVSNSMRWTCLYLATSPEVQRRVHEELDRELPQGRLPCLDDRSRLPYLNATILEIQRRASTLSNGTIHVTTADVNFEGYFIPKDTGVMTSIEMFHHDPDLWEKPYETYPEHFLDSEGKLVSKRDGFMPFQLGRRQCIGETIARMTLFFFTAALLQTFEVSPPPGVKLSLEVDPTEFISRQPYPFKTMLRKRF